MKRIIALILIAVMCLSIVACGNETEAENTTKDSSNTTVEDVQPVEELLIGKWTCEREAGQDRITEASVYTIELYKGGSCYVYNWVEKTDDKYNNHSGKWSVNDDILTLDFGNASFGYVIDMSEESYTLTEQIDSSVVLHKEEK